MAARMVKEEGDGRNDGQQVGGGRRVLLRLMQCIPTYGNFLCHNYLLCHKFQMELRAPTFLFSAEERLKRRRPICWRQWMAFILGREPKKGHTAKDLDDVSATATPAEKEDLFEAHGTQAYVREGCLVLQ
ncbi:hypothetical protein EJ110_NYTH53454 [Nymphaea thermarum]|nr:hypothetical protein EJ110_NYTH53454 [Nymphaea thermarum]